METHVDLRDAIFEGVETYTKTTFELFKLKAVETGIRMATSLVSSMTVLAVIGLFVLILNIGIAFALGELLGKVYYGFFIVAAFYLVLGIVFHYFLRKWLQRPVSKLIIVYVLQ